MMLAAGKHRLEVKEAKPKERRRLARAERVLARYQEIHGPLSHTTPAMVLDLARKVAHHRAMLNDPKYAYWFKTGTVHTDHLPAPKPEKKKKFDYTEYKTRQIEERAADPEKFEREKAARRREINKFWFDNTEARAFDQCNAALLEIRLGYPDPANYNRLRDIWGTIVTQERSEKMDNIYLGQVSRLRNEKNLGRVRGVGRAARLAGF